MNRPGGEAKKPFLERLLPDRLIGWLALALLAVVIAAVVRGQAMWGVASPSVWAHLGLAMLVLALTPVMLWRGKGTKSHRALGWIWALSMMGLAAISFAIRLTPGGGLSWIHLLSAWVLIAVPRLVFHARRHQVASHRDMVRGLSIFALLVAGSFTFGFHRMLAVWLMH
jgi:uncharacterized membrane protein